MSEQPTRPRRERGSGSIFKPQFKDGDGQIRECPHWRISYYRHGVRFVENAQSDKITVAKELLRKRLGEIVQGQFTPPSTEKTGVEELVDATLRDYRVNERKSLDLSEKRWLKHLKPFFGKMRAVDVTTDAINRYVEKRLAQGAENGTINRELALLRRAFNLAYHSTPRKVHQVPNFPRLKENPPRKGFVDDAQYRLLVQHCGELWLRALLATAYAFGFRKAELLNLRVRQVNLPDGAIVLDPGTTKNDDGRTVKMTGEVQTLLQECVHSKGPDDFVFTRADGQPVRDLRDRWDKLITVAGLKGLLLHDLRRSAVRNMVRSGVPERVAMAISGHKTRAVFDRYNIVSDADLAEAARKIERGQENSLSTAQVPALEEGRPTVKPQLIN
jgi:integrase